MRCGVCVKSIQTEVEWTLLGCDAYRRSHKATQETWARRERREKEEGEGEGVSGQSTLPWLGRRAEEGGQGGEEEWGSVPESSGRCTPCLGRDARFPPPTPCGHVFCW